MKLDKRWLSGLAASAIVVTGVFAGAQPASAATPDWEPDSNGNGGTISFYDSTGQQVTSGTNLSHLFDYAVASSAEDPAGFHKASIFFAFPNHAQPTADWFVNGQTTSTTYPNASAPAPVNTFTNPVATIGASEANLTAALGGGTLDNTTGYADIMQIRLVQSGGFGGAYWSADIMFDTGAGTWTQVYPSVTTPTTTSLAVGPNPSAVGQNVTLTATVTPNDVPGSVQFKDGTTNLGAPVAVAVGQAQTTVAFSSGGAHSLHAVFTPTDTNTFAPSTGNATQVVNADTSSLTISRSTTIKYGSSTTTATTLTDSTSTTPIGSVFVQLQRRSGTTWVQVASVKTSSTGKASKSVAPTGRTTYRWYFAGNATHKSAASASQTVSVAQVVSARSTTGSVKHGVTFKIYGTVKPASSGQKVTLQRLSGTKWVGVTTVSIAKQKLPNGTTTVGFVFSVKQGTKGTFKYRVYRPSTAMLLAGYSTTLIVKVI